MSAVASIPIVGNRAPSLAAVPTTAVTLQKPARLPALTGLRCFAALNIVFFHFSNPQWFGFLAPIVNAGYASVSYFILLSGFVMAYNYSERGRAGQLDKGRFWLARFTRLYPVYFLSLVLAWWMVPTEYHAHSHGMFWTGVALAPLLLQGWVPQIATFLNTPAWTMSAEAFYYFVFPWMAKWKRPRRVSVHLVKMAGIWALGIVPGALYFFLNPDGLTHTDRWSWGFWLQALKYTPLPHFPSFIFGVMLAGLDELIDRESPLRLFLGAFGMVAIFTILYQADHIPYAIIHDGLLMPLFGCLILGLAGKNILAAIIGCAPLAFVGESSYCLYLLHFNMWKMLHRSHILNRLGLIQFDPWLSYVILICLALLTLHFIEKPAQQQMRRLLKIRR